MPAPDCTPSCRYAALFGLTAALGAVGVAASVASIAPTESSGREVPPTSSPSESRPPSAVLAPAARPDRAAALAPALGVPAPVASSVEPASIELGSAPPSILAGPRRLPALDGLLLEPGVEAERLDAWYAAHDAEALARAEFRLLRLIEAFEADPTTSPVVWLLPSDLETVRAELAVVFTRLAARPAELGAVEVARCEDGDAAFERRHARASAEDLHVALWRTQRARVAYENQVYDAHVARHDFEVLPESSLFA
ncbi:MAG: hypothetical protein IPJ77_13595 [Planctomycetes bacterium]|nr:hypothetical protein [Planctomycetota bacterium]